MEGKLLSRGRRSRLRGLVHKLMSDFVLQPDDEVLAVVYAEDVTELAGLCRRRLDKPAMGNEQL